MEQGDKGQHGDKWKLNATGSGKDQQEKCDCRTESGFIS